MKITFVVPHGGRSGGVRSTVKVANGLLRRGHKVRLLAIKSKRNLRTKLRHLWWSTYYSNHSDWVGLFDGKVERAADIEQCAFEGNEIVVASGWLAAIEVRQVKHPGIIKVHIVRSRLQDPDDMRKSWGEDVPKLAISSFVAESINEACHQEVTAVIPNAIDLTEYYPCLTEEMRNGIGSIFGRSWHKDPEFILAVLTRLRERRPQVPQRVFGAARRPKDIPHRDYFRLPSLEKAREIYSQSLVWFVGSCSEGFCVPILEAMACGCAVVATDCGGPRDIITDGENGFLVEVGNIGQALKKIELLLDNAELRCHFVERSRLTLEKYTWDKSVDQLERVLSRLQL